MARTLSRLRERTNGFTVTPAQYVKLAFAALAALTLIVMTGAAVRLSGSGLGCPTWPKCYGHLYPPLNSHAIIEFSNRVVSVPVVLAAGLAWLGALRRRPYRRDLARLSALLPLGVIAQAVLGGLTVRGALDYGWVMAHFALSMLVVLAAVLLVWRATSERRVRAPARWPGMRERALVLWARALPVLAGVTIFAGTAATAAGPHAGGSPGQRINRLSFEGRGTMDFVIHRHGEIALFFALAALGLWWRARRAQVLETAQRPLTVLCALLALQGAVGLDQYKTHLPTELVWVHVTLACCTWIATLWAALAAGPLPERVPAGSAERPADGAIVAVGTVEFPGN
jgi:cytochrome c oxidase assembly protein subunit 15